MTLAGLDPLLAIPAAGCLAAIVAAVLVPLMFRLEGPYFAIGSWVVAEALRLGCAQVQAARRRNRDVAVQRCAGQHGGNQIGGGAASAYEPIAYVTGCG